jgi:U3 small nucleolar RNA-associated protein 25
MRNEIRRSRLISSAYDRSRRKIIRNNEKLAHSQANNTTLPDSFEQRDQSFTRPKVLLLLPFRSLALHWLQTHLFPLAPEGTQIENLKPFTSSFSLPEDIADPLADPEKAANYPRDHISTFSGNSDDNFRFGIKFTRKAWRVILPPANEEKLIGCDIIVASPLGIRMGSDKEGGTDSLSSIEICVADGLDVMAMQNWEHVQVRIPSRLYQDYDI